MAPMSYGLEEDCLAKDNRKFTGAPDLINPPHNHRTLNLHQLNWIYIHRCTTVRMQQLGIA